MRLLRRRQPAPAPEPTPVREEETETPWTARQHCLEAMLDEVWRQEAAWKEEDRIDQIARLVREEDQP